MATLDELTKAFRDIHKAEMAEPDLKRRAHLAQQANLILSSIQSLASDTARPAGGAPTVAAPSFVGADAPTVDAPTAAAAAMPVAAPTTPAERAQRLSASMQGSSAPSVPGFEQRAQQPDSSPGDLFGLGGATPPAAGTTSMPQPGAQPAPGAPGAAPPAPDDFPDFKTWLANASRGGGGVSASARSGATAVAAEAAAASKAEYDAITARAAGKERAGKTEGATVADYVTNLAIAGQEHADKDSELRQAATDALAKSQQATDEFKQVASEGTLAQSLGSGSGKIMSAISVALGAASAGFSGSKVNPGLQVLNARLEADMRDRMDRLRGKAEARDQLDGLYKAHLAALGDERAAADRTKSDILEQLQLEVQRQAAVSGGEDARAAGDVVVKGMAAEQARAREAAANQVLLAQSKRSGAGRKSTDEIYAQWLKAQKNKLENDKLGGEVDAQRNPGAGSDLGSIEGARAATRKKAVFEATNDLDAVIEQGTKLLTTIGTPDRVTRAVAGTPGALLLSNKSQEQLGALALFTQNMTRSMQGARPSDRDAVISKLELLRQGVTTGKQGVDTIIRDILDLAKSSRARAASFDPQAAAAYDRARAAGAPAPTDSNYTPPTFVGN